MTARQIAASDLSPIQAPWDFPGYVVGNWYLGTAANAYIQGSGTAPGTGSIRLYLFCLKQKITINALGTRVTTISASGNVQAAIYANNLATMRPTGSALASTASLSTASAASVNAAVSVQLDPGFYWFATNCDNATAAFPSIPSNAAQQSCLLGSATQANDLTTSTLSGLSVGQAFGTWPDLTSASFTEVVGGNTMPLVQFKVASIP